MLKKKKLKYLKVEDNCGEEDDPVVGFERKWEGAPV